MRRILTLSLIWILSIAGVAHSTVVIPPTFEALVTSASTIFVGEVTDVRSRWTATTQGRAITTDVTFKVEEVWKGGLGSTTQLQFLGGTIGETTMEVVGMPTFRVPQRSVLFVSGEVRSVSPLVGFYYGRMRVEKDPYGVDRIRTFDGRSLGATSHIGARSLFRQPLSMTPMRLSELEAAVRAKLAAR